ncbi:MAG TPA: RluA family pseudouridine synthase [Ktedonobacteraceae bacterium]|jgi:23S rRNA-/tRNA-specific pseudouridylate synthase
MEQQYIPIIYQDHHLLIVDKPAGLVIHPTYKHSSGTMWDLLLAWLAQQQSDGWCPPALPDERGWERAPEAVRQLLRSRRTARYWQEEGWLARPALLHRLDKDTSGVVALARTQRACRHIVRQFHEQSIEKTYLAVARRGSPAWAQPRVPLQATLQRGAGEQISCPLDLSRLQGWPLLLDAPLQRDPQDRRRCIVGAQGQAAITQIRVLAGCGDYLLIEASPVTGRTHQIRAHLAAAGYPLVGDGTYAPPAAAGSPEAGLARHFLHALRLRLRDYPADQWRTFMAPLPPELVAWLRSYFPAEWLAAGVRAGELETNRKGGQESDAGISPPHVCGK